MNEENGVVEYKLGTLTQGVRFVAGVGPKTATRVGLGVALALEDAATDPAGELLGAKLNQGAGALASTIGSITTSVGAGVRSSAKRLGADGGLIKKVPVLENARHFVSEAASELNEAWMSAGYVAVQVETPALSPDGSDTQPTAPSSDPIEEVNS